METTRKNFNFDSRLIEAAEIQASQSKRSLTKYIEFLIERDVRKAGLSFMICK